MDGAKKKYNMEEAHKLEHPGGKASDYHEEHEVEDNSFLIIDMRAMTGKKISQPEVVEDDEIDRRQEFSPPQVVFPFYKPS